MMKRTSDVLLLPVMDKTLERWGYLTISVDEVTQDWCVELPCYHRLSWCRNPDGTWTVSVRYHSVGRDGLHSVIGGPTTIVRTFDTYREAFEYLEKWAGSPHVMVVE